ncbi:hypothetical protein FNV43_RR04321 [Rhamnella rubrinervis]|uniref:NAD-dependent epimerase/dehydratase domain-containing protein n=1 Tax=Rhamnella rubrinervis TaxID=2594499 RepID=A0A8K0HK31_9ROSA|nr:hypothetical protein FNV43_RR04321 [Rhamnella rubrinervis]
MKPTHVFNAASVTGLPKVDRCKSHRVETIQTNMLRTLPLADVCRERGLIFINYSTGCIFEYNSGHSLSSGIRLKEEDMPNFIGSFYSNTKAMMSIYKFDHVDHMRMYGKCPVWLANGTCAYPPKLVNGVLNPVYTQW